MKILMKVDVIRMRAFELSVPNQGELSLTEIDINESTVDQLIATGFRSVGPLEFNLYESGLAGSETEEK